MNAESSVGAGRPIFRASRRQFARSAVGSAVGVFAAPAIVRGCYCKEKIGIAGRVGVGGRGPSNRTEDASENIAAICAARAGTGTLLPRR